MGGLMRHMKAVRNVTLPGDYVAFHLGEIQVGWVTGDAARILVARGCVRAGHAVRLPDARRLPALAERLAAAGTLPWRGEAFDVREAPGGAVLATVDRGALPWFGIAAEGVHVNGLVRRDDGLHLWVARRSADRLMDPGKLDHLFAGGIPAGLTPHDALLKEGAEEAGLAPDLVAQAKPAGTITYAMRRPEGLRRDCLHCYDLEVPPDLIPTPGDGEVATFASWPIARVIGALRETDDFKFNVGLVLIAFLLRLDLLPDPEEASSLRAALKGMLTLHNPDASSTYTC